MALVIESGISFIFLRHKFALSLEHKLNNESSKFHVEHNFYKTRPIKTRDQYARRHRLIVIGVNNA